MASPGGGATTAGGSGLRPLPACARPRPRGTARRPAGPQGFPGGAPRVLRANVARLMDAARSLQPKLRALTYKTLIGLLSLPGMPSGEAIGLAVLGMPSSTSTADSRSGARLQEWAVIDPRS